jgi:outer membrane protein, heavy metal efflux system
MKRFYLIFFTASLVVPLRAAEKNIGAKTGKLSLAEITRVVLAENPTIQSARAKWAMMKERVPQAAAWEDLMAGADVERFGTSQFITFTDIEWMVAQEIPISGKNRSRARIASAEAIAAFEQYRRAQLDAVAKARSAFYGLANARARLALNRQNVELLEQFADLARARYEAGTQQQSDVLTAESELTMLLEEQIELELTRVNAQTQLNVLMDREPAAPLGEASLEFTDFKPEPEQLHALMLANRPELQAARAQVAVERAKLQLAKRQWFPDPQVRVEARQLRDAPSGRGDLSEYDTGIFFSVPWTNYRKYAAQGREAHRGIEMARHELEAAENEAGGLLRDQLQKIVTLKHHYHLFEERLLPLARQTSDSVIAGYETDKSSVLDVLTAQRRTREAEAKSWQHLAEYKTALAELESIVGADLGIFQIPSRRPSK